MKWAKILIFTTVTNVTLIMNDTIYFRGVIKKINNMKRTIIKIDEEKCNGCGLCVEGCHEGALRLIDGKARMISDLYCDGLGACIGECPVGAIELEEREAEPYDENAVMDRLVAKGEATIRAHLLHLKAHNEMGFLKLGIEYLKEKNIMIDMKEILENQSPEPAGKACGCPGAREMSFAPKNEIKESDSEMPSQLRQWPVQLHLLNPQANYLHHADVVLAADCTAFAYGSFHQRFLKNHALAIACPKLDAGQEIYIEKLTAMIDSAKINTLTVIVMEVPCCGGLLQIAKKAVDNANRKIPVKKIVIGIKGDILQEEWI